MKFMIIGQIKAKNTAIMIQAQYLQIAYKNMSLMVIVPLQLKILQLLMHYVSDFELF